MAAIETKAKRKPNWTQEECLLLVTLINENKHVLRSRPRAKFDISDEAGHLGKNFQAIKCICSDSTYHGGNREEMEQYPVHKQSRIIDFSKTEHLTW